MRASVCAQVLGVQQLWASAACFSSGAFSQDSYAACSGLRKNLRSLFRSGVPSLCVRMLWWTHGPHQALSLGMVWPGRFCLWNTLPDGCVSTSVKPPDCVPRKLNTYYCSDDGIVQQCVCQRWQRHKVLSQGHVRLFLQVRARWSDTKLVRMRLRFRWHLGVAPEFLLGVMSDHINPTNCTATNSQASRHEHSMSLKIT